MAGQSFVTATLWGQGREAENLSGLAGGVRDGEDECMICRADVPSVVAFEVRPRRAAGTLRALRCSRHSSLRACGVSGFLLAPCS